MSSHDLKKGKVGLKNKKGNWQKEKQGKGKKKQRNKQSELDKM
jgi:hypothetical protein